MADKNEIPAEKPAPKTSSMRCLTLLLSGCKINSDAVIASDFIPPKSDSETASTETPPNTDQGNGR